LSAAETMVDMKNMHTSTAKTILFTLLISVAFANWLKDKSSKNFSLLKYQKKAVTGTIFRILMPRGTE